MKSAYIAVALSAHVALASAADAPTSHEQFDAGIKATLAPLSGKSVAALKVLYLSADVGPWLDTGIELQKGDRVTMVLQGNTWWSRAYDMRLEPDLATWARIGSQGPIFRGIGRGYTITAQHAGPLQLKHLSGLWIDRSGRYTADPAPVNPDAGGGISVAILRWSPDSDIALQLRTIAAREPSSPWVQSALKDLEGRQPPPQGWVYLWELGPTEIFREVTGDATDGGPRRRIEMHTHNDVAILQKDTAVDFTPRTRLQWQWKIDALPSAAAENVMPNHDYLSIAVEFDNGQDITYLWSRELPVGQAFRCPIPGWNQRETHIVARTGAAELGKWLAEEKNVFEDYKNTVGGALPKRITRIWLITVSIFKRGEGRGEIGDIRLLDGPKVVQVW